jgi:uncharacterized delta-60 repeat protein
MQSRGIVLMAVLASSGCGDVRHGDGGGTDGSGEADAGDTTGDPGFTMTIETPNASIPLDGMNRVAVEITRTGGFTGPVAISGVSPPTGLTITDTTIAQDMTSADVIIGAAAPLVIGDAVTLSIEATGDGVAPQTATIEDAPVTGQPGSLDTTFGPGTGLATISFGGDDDGVFQALDVIDGSVVAVGFGIGGLGTVQIASMRFTAAGDVDTTWNGGELSRVGFDGSSNDAARAVATGQQVDGRSIAIGFHRDNGVPGDVALARYSLTGGGGGVDFGSEGGKSLVNLAGDEVVNDGLVLPTSQILAVGAIDGHFAVARMTPTGFLDTSFAAPAGFDRAVLGESSQADSVAIDSQARVVVAGTLTAAGQRDLVVRRYLADGMLDVAFATGGELLVQGADDEQAVAVITIGDRIVVAATASDGRVTRFRVRRLLATGELDASFGAEGVAEVDVAAGVEALDMAALPDGRIVVLGNAAGEALLARFTRQGAVDTLFGPAGTGLTQLFIGDNGVPGAIEVYSEHLIVVGGGNQGGTPGPGTFGILARMWM